MADRLGTPRSPLACRARRVGAVDRDNGHTLDLAPPGDPAALVPEMGYAITANDAWERAHGSIRLHEDARPHDNDAGLSAKPGSYLGTMRFDREQDRGRRERTPGLFTVARAVPGGRDPGGI